MSSDKLERTAKGKRPKYLDERANDSLLRMLLVTVQELSVTRDRLAALETVLENADLIPAAAVDKFEPDGSWDDMRSKDREELMQRLFSDLQASINTQ